MSKEKVQKLEKILGEINQSIEDRKKSSRRNNILRVALMASCVITLIVSVIITNIRGRINGLDIFSISLLVCILYGNINDFLEFKIKNQYTLETLESMKDDCERLLDKMYIE